MCEDSREERSITFYDSSDRFVWWSGFIVFHFRSYCRVCRCGVLGFLRNFLFLHVIDGTRESLGQHSAWSPELGLNSIILQVSSAVQQYLVRTAASPFVRFSVRFLCLFGRSSVSLLWGSRVRHIRKISACWSVVQSACFHNRYQSLQVNDRMLLENRPRLHRVVFKSVFTLFHSRSLERTC